MVSIKDFYKQFGDLVRRYRREADLTQKQLAQRVGITRSSIANIESGKQHPHLHMLHLLASALGKEPTLLLPVARETAVKPPLSDKSLVGLNDETKQWISNVIGNSKQGGNA